MRTANRESDARLRAVSESHLMKDGDGFVVRTFDADRRRWVVATDPLDFGAASEYMTHWRASRTAALLEETR